MPEFYYKLLQRICEKPYIDYQGLREDFCHKKDLDFQQGLDFLWLNDYIIVKPFKSAAEDTGESYLIRNSNGAVKPIKIGPYMHLISSVRGTTFVDDRRRRFWGSLFLMQLQPPFLSLLSSCSFITPFSLNVSC